MPSYYFSLRNHQAVERHEPSREYPDLRTAMIDAHGKARAILRNQLRRSGTCSPQESLDVEDEHHRPIARIMFADLVRQLS